MNDEPGSSNLISRNKRNFKILLNRENSDIQEVSLDDTGLSSLTKVATFIILLTPKSATFKCPESSRNIFLHSYSQINKKPSKFKKFINPEKMKSDCRKI